jgi:hypothetical protein
MKRKQKWTKAELLENHRGCRKVMKFGDCYDEMEIALVNLLLSENKELRRRKKKMKATGIIIEPKKTVMTAYEIKIPAAIFEMTDIEPDEELEIFVDRSNGMDEIILRPEGK